MRAKPLRLTSLRTQRSRGYGVRENAKRRQYTSKRIPNGNLLSPLSSMSQRLKRQTKKIPLATTERHDQYGSTCSAILTAHPQPPKRHCHVFLRGRNSHASQTGAEAGTTVISATPHQTHRFREHSEIRAPRSSKKNFSSAEESSHCPA